GQEEETEETGEEIEEGQEEETEETGEEIEEGQEEETEETGEEIEEGQEEETEETGEEIEEGQEEETEETGEEIEEGQEEETEETGEEIEEGQEGGIEDDLDEEPITGDASSRIDQGGSGGVPGGETFGFDLDDHDGRAEEVGPDRDPSEFEESDYRTDIPRIDIGVEGLDEMIQGGIPQRTLSVAIGGPGTGKTTFGIQFLNEALESGERAVFIALDETRDRIITTAEEKGWSFEKYAESGDLVVIDLDPVDMANSLTSIRNELPGLIANFGASRITIDSVSLLEMMYDDQATRRTEIYDFARSLKSAGVTTMLTSESDEDNPFVSRYGVIEYLTDAVFVLRFVRPQEFQPTRLAIEIQKIRDANHSRETKPYEITSTGIEVYRQANIF
ncbi:MAG: KaiC domain-containing protein, partial [Halodesulfurarchaeum sp.]